MSANAEMPLSTDEMPSSGKGKGKAVDQTQVMDEDDSEEESAAEEVILWN
jgi:hypothetical protein